MGVIKGPLRGSFKSPWNNSDTWSFLKHPDTVLTSHERFWSPHEMPLRFTETSSTSPERTEYPQNSPLKLQCKSYEIRRNPLKPSEIPLVGQLKFFLKPPIAPSTSSLHFEQIYMDSFVRIRPDLVPVWAPGDTFRLSYNATIWRLNIHNFPSKSQ